MSTKKTATKGQGSKVKLSRNVGGRPTTYDLELADYILERISLGESMRSISRDPDMPAMSTLFKWLREHKEFSELYTRAKIDESSEVYADKIVDIADATAAGRIDPNAARVAIDAYKWTAAKLKPRKYGDKIDYTSDGKALPQPIILINSQKSDSDTKRDVIEADVNIPEREKEIPTLPTNIMDDMNT